MAAQERLDLTGVTAGVPDDFLAERQKLLVKVDGIKDKKTAEALRELLKNHLLGTGADDFITSEGQVVSLTIQVSSHEADTLARRFQTIIDDINANRSVSAAEPVSTAGKSVGVDFGGGLTLTRGFTATEEPIEHTGSGSVINALFTFDENVLSLQEFYSRLQAIAAELNETIKTATHTNGHFVADGNVVRGEIDCGVGGIGEFIKKAIPEALQNNPQQKIRVERNNTAVLPEEKEGERSGKVGGDSGRY